MTSTAATTDGPVLDVVVPVHNEEADLAASVRRLHDHLVRRSRGRSGSRSPTTRAPTAPGGSPGARRDPAGVGVHLAEKGAGRALQRVWSSPTPGARLHGRRPLHRPQRPAAPRRTADVRPLRRRSAPGSPGLAGRARPQARAHLPATTSCCAGTLRRPVLRRAVRLQGDPRRRRPGCCRWSRTRAGSSTPSCSCSPSGPGCASTRCRSTGSTTRTAGSHRRRPEPVRRGGGGGTSRVVACLRGERGGERTGRGRGELGGGGGGGDLARGRLPVEEIGG